MENITRTVYGSFLQTCLLTGLPFTLAPNTTLNEKFSIQNGVLPPNKTYPSMDYIVIGNGGHRMSVGANGVAKPEPIQHRATDAALFNHLPFVLREPSNDLSLVERNKYGLRRVEQHNNLNYIAYYLKRVDIAAVAPMMQYKTVQDDGTVVTSAFSADSSNLNPSPSDLSPTGVNVVTGDYVTASAILPVVLDATDVTELLNVANILYGDDSYAIISEIGLVSGVDKVISVSNPGQGNFNFNEVIAAQIVSFVNTFYPVKFTNNGVQLLLDVGATEPLLQLTTG